MKTLVIAGALSIGMMLMCWSVLGQTIDRRPPLLAGGSIDAGAASTAPKPSPPADATPMASDATPAAGAEAGRPAPGIDTVPEIVSAARAGRWLVALGLGLSLVVAGLKWLAKQGGITWFHTDRGGAILVGATSLLGALSTAWVGPGAKLDGATFAAALAVTWTACGGYTWVKRIVWPSDGGVTAKA